MPKVTRIVALLAIVAIISALPLTAFAQSPPHVLVGNAMLNGAMPAINTEIIAMQGDTTLGSAMTMAGGRYTLQVRQPSGTGPITFTIAGVDASERLTGWQLGKVENGFNISAQGAGTISGLGPPGPAGPAGPAGRDGPAGPRGAQGPAGPNGADGADGAAGADGDVGPTGNDGLRGPVGPKGQPGAAGPAGPQGPVGAVGPQGPDGAAGPAGAAGSDASGNNSIIAIAIATMATIIAVAMPLIMRRR